MHHYTLNVCRYQRDAEGKRTKVEQSQRFIPCESFDAKRQEDGVVLITAAPTSPTSAEVTIQLPADGDIIYVQHPSSGKTVSRIEYKPNSADYVPGIEVKTPDGEVQILHPVFRTGEDGEFNRR